MLFFYAMACQGRYIYCFKLLNILQMAARRQSLGIFRSLQFVTVCWQSHGIQYVRCKFALQLTARQYGEVVLPDATSGHDPDTIATRLSRCKEGMAHFLPSGYKFYRTLRVLRYNVDRSQKTVKIY
jgi:hypothetical protein